MRVIAAIGAAAAVVVGSEKSTREMQPIRLAITTHLLTKPIHSQPNDGIDIKSTDATAKNANRDNEFSFYLSEHDSTTDDGRCLPL